MKKLIILFILLISVSCIYAKDLVYIPTAMSLDGVKASFDYDLNDKNNICNVSCGYNGIEASFTNYCNEFDEDKFMPSSKSIINAQWQILPEIGFVPAVAVGAKDLNVRLNKIPAFYAVATKDFSDFILLDLLNKLSVTAGISCESLGFFGGLELGVGVFYATGEFYKEDCNYSAGIKLFDDVVRIGYKKFNKNNYIDAQVGITF